MNRESRIHRLMTALRRACLMRHLQRRSNSLPRSTQYVLTWATLRERRKRWMELAAYPGGMVFRGPPSSRWAMDRFRSCRCST